MCSSDLQSWRSIAFCGFASVEKDTAAKEQVEQGPSEPAGEFQSHTCSSGSVQDSHSVQQLERQTGTGELFVGRTTDHGALGCAIASALRRSDECRVLASGDEAVVQFVKGVAVARTYIKRRREGDVCFQANHLFWYCHWHHDASTEI